MLMERWFDLHLYLANWGTHRLMLRLPKRLVDRYRLEDILQRVDCAKLKVSGENLILTSSARNWSPRMTGTTVRAGSPHSGHCVQMTGRRSAAFLSTVANGGRE